MSIADLISKYNVSLDNKRNTEKFKTVIDHTRMEHLIFNDKKTTIDEQYKDFDYTIAELEKDGSEKLKTFPHLSEDLFHMFYKMIPEEREESELDENVLKFNKKIIDKVKENGNYSALKLLTQGMDFESIEATREFTKELYDNLDELLEDIAGDKNTLNAVDKLNEAYDSKKKQMEELVSLYQTGQKQGKTEEELMPIQKKMKAIDQQLEGITRQQKGFEEVIKAHYFKNQEKVEKKLDKIMGNALEKVHEIRDYLDSFGAEEGRPKTIEGKRELLNKINSNKKFKNIAQMIGKMRRMAKASLNKSFIHDRGEKVGITYGNKLNKVLPSEFGLLANKDTEILFYRKYLNKKLKQHKERAKVFKGRGPIITFVDESGSTQGGKEHWAKALAIALMDISVKGRRNFAYIPFDCSIGNMHHVNHENFSEDIVLEIANSFLGGGTDFTKPLEVGIELIMDSRYENADVVFITDGQAEIRQDVLERFNKIKEEKKVKCIGILLDKGGTGGVSDITLKKFCNQIYKTSELSEDDVAARVMQGVV